MLLSDYGDVLSGVPRDGTATTEQRIAAAAANPAFNPEIAEANRNNQIGVGNIGPIGLTKTAENIQTKDAERVLQQDLANQVSDADRGGHQSAILGNTLTASGIRNVGGSYAQGGDNQGLPSDYLVVGSSDGSQEVWGPDGKTYSSVEEAKANIPNAEKDKAKAQVENLVKSGASGTQVSQAAFKAGLDASDRAALTAKALSNQGPSRREQAEINRRAAEAKAAEEKAAAERQAHLDTLTQPEQHKFKAEEAIASGDAGDMKSTIYELRKAGVIPATGSLKKKSNSELKRILEGVQVAPPPVAPPPQPVAQAAPVVQPAVVPPQPVAQVTPAPTPVVTPPPAVLPTAPAADPFDWANNPNNPANAGKVVPISEWGDQTPQKGK